MPEYTVKNSAILHNGRRYEEGSTITLTESEAKALKGLLDEKPSALITDTSGEPGAPDEPVAEETNAKGKRGGRR